MSKDVPQSAPLERRRPKRPLIAVTAGDPSGIGPEVCVKAAEIVRSSDALDMLLLGDLEVFRRAASCQGCRLELRRVDRPEDAVGQRFVGVLDPRDGAPIDFEIGKSSADAGHAALQWIDCAHELGRQRRIDGVVFGPVNSDALKLTGLIQHIDDLQPTGTYMLRVSGALRVMPLTEHVRMRDIAATVTRSSVLSAARALDTALRQWGFATPKIAVAGLNPHAMYEEDREEIAPAVVELEAQGVRAVGPISPDAVFRQAMSGAFDAVVTMYHDQGQIALKTAAFQGACTLYVGLDYVQIAIPHGTAYDIAGKGLADPSSMAAGIRMAARLSSGSGFG